MQQKIAHITLVVDHYDEAIAFYTEKLHFTLVEDTPLGEDRRWVVVAPQGPAGCDLLLAKADNERQVTRIGDQTGGRVFLFLYTDDFQRDYRQMQENGIRFVSPPRQETYGIVAVFEDLYGNLWDLLQPAGVNADADPGAQPKK